MLLFATLGVLWWSEQPNDESAAAPSSSPARLQWRVGSSQQYDVRVDSSMQMIAAAAGVTQDIRVRMNAVLDLLTLEVNPGATWVGLRLSAATLQVAGDSDPETNRALGVPFRVRFASGGMPDAFEFPAGVTAQHRIILENLIRTFQVTMQAGDNWVAQESNASGSYEAVYQRTATSLVEKTKRSFVGHPSAPAYVGAEIASTETFRAVAQRDWLAEMTVDETVRTEVQGGPALAITNHATLRLRPDARAAADPETFAFVAAAAEPTEPAVPSLSREEAYRQIRSNVATLDVAVEGRTVQIHRLRDLLRVDETLPTALLELMQTDQLTDRTRADLYLAFELAGTEAAQSALTSVIGDPAWSMRDSMRAIVALGGVARPSPDTQAALWVTAQSAPSTDDGRLLASTATFALGSLGQTMNVAGDPDYSLLSARLLNGAVGGADTEQRTNFVHALGNTRDASLARDVVALLDDPAPEVRRAAALSLGMLDPNQAAEELMSHFDQERNSEVRGAIAESLVNWTEPTAPAVAAIRAGIRAEYDENTRYNMARFLGANLAKFPESRPVLQDLLRTEKSRRIRRSVAEALVASG
jgi:hypothetical protein